MLKLEHVKKSYDGVSILKDINLEIEDGEIVSILGPSGCGKTTLLNLILGLTDADQGNIIFDGEDITSVPMEKTLYFRIMHCSRILLYIRTLYMDFVTTRTFLQKKKWMI